MGREGKGMGKVCVIAVGVTDAPDAPDTWSGPKGGGICYPKIRMLILFVVANLLVNL